MDGRLFTTPDRIIEAAALFASEGFERSFEEVLGDPVPAFRGTERPMREVRPACRAESSIPTGHAHPAREVPYLRGSPIHT